MTTTTTKQTTIKNMKPTTTKAVKDMKKIFAYVRDFLESQNAEKEVLDAWNTETRVDELVEFVKPQTKSKKPDSYPKGHRSAYFIFQADKRSEGGTYTAKRLAELWKTMSDEEKTPYKNKANDDLERFKTELQDWENANPEEASKLEAKKKTKKTAPKKKKDGPKAPKKPSKRAAHQFYIAARKDEYLAEHEGAKYAEVRKALGAEWKELSDEDKEEFKAQETADTERWEKEMVDWEKEMENLGLEIPEKKVRKVPKTKEGATEDNNTRVLPSFIRKPRNKKSTTMDVEDALNELCDKDKVAELEDALSDKDEVADLIEEETDEESSDEESSDEESEPDEVVGCNHFMTRKKTLCKAKVVEGSDKCRAHMKKTK